MIAKPVHVCKRSWSLSRPFLRKSASSLRAATTAREGRGKQSRDFTRLDWCVSSLRRGRADLLCIVSPLTDDPRRDS